MIEKIITPHDFKVPQVNIITPSEHFGIKCARENGVSACGRKATGCGSSCATKQANEDLKSFIRTLKPDPRYLFLHIIAMGSGEYFGPNTNGDYFPETGGALVTKGLLEKYDTFRTIARLFKHHINKDPDKSYGRVPFSTYNNPMHRVELVVSVDRGKAPDITQRAENGERLGFSMSCFPPGTPVLLVDGREIIIDQIGVGEEVRTHTGGAGVVDGLMQRDYIGDMVSFRAYGLPDEIFCTPNHKIWTRPIIRGKTKCPVCCKTFKVLNAHLWQTSDPQHQHAYRNYEKYAEGMTRADELCHGDYVRTPFNTTISENGDANYADILGYYLAEGHIFNSDKTRACMHCVDFTFHIKENNYVDELVACLRKDGCERISIYKQPEHNRQVVRSRDPALLKKLLRDANRLSHELYLSPEIMGWHPTTQMRILNKYINGDGHFNSHSKQINCTTTSRRLAFQLATIAWRNGICANIQRYKPKNKKAWYSIVIASSNVLKCTTDKIPNDFNCITEYSMGIGHLNNQTKGLVVKRKVAKEFNYIENGFVYRKIYRIQKRQYTGKVYNISVGGDNSYVVNGVAVSNCRIPWDRCSICGNKARTRSEYCTHIMNHLLEIQPDGKQVYMINEDPTFFDISYVLRPADKTAMLLSKVASEGKPSCSIILTEGGENTQKSGDIKKEFETILEPAMDDGQREGFCKYIMPLLKEAEPDIPIDALKDFPINDILSTLTLCGIICKPHEYNRIIITTNNPDDFKPDISHNGFNDAVYHTIKDIVPARSFYNPYMNMRLIILGIKQDTQNPKEATEYIIKTPPAKEQDHSMRNKLLMLGALGGGAYAAYKTELGRKALSGIIEMIEKKPGKFLLIAGLGALALDTAPILGKQVVSDSFIKYHNGVPYGMEGVIVNTKQSSLIPGHIQVVAKQALDPFGMLYLKNSIAEN